VKRLTNNVGKGANQSFVPEYATTGAFSQNDLYLLLRSTDAYAWEILDLNGNVVISASTMDGALPNATGIWHWDTSSDTTLWQAQGNVLYKCTFSPSADTMNCAGQHTFTEYPYAVVFPSDSDVNPNGWVPMVGQATMGSTADLFMYNLNTLTKSVVAHTTTCTGDANNSEPMNNCIHRLMATPNNGMTAEFGGSNGMEGGGEWLWEPGFSSWVELQSQTNHHNPGKDLSGNEVATWETSNGVFSANGGNPISPCTSTWNPIVTILSSSTTNNGSVDNCLFDVVNQNYNSGSWHVSYLDWPNRAWVAYSMQGSNNAERWNNDSRYQNPSVSGWNLYDDEILLVRIDAAGDPAKKYRLALSHSRELEGYWEEPHAVISRSGNYIAFESNAAWGASGCGSDSNDNACADVYLIRMH